MNIALLQVFELYLSGKILYMFPLALFFEINITFMKSFYILYVILFLHFTIGGYLCCSLYSALFLLCLFPSFCAAMGISVYVSWCTCTHIL